MGRLTLNLLLGFAQFEREVTGERIRDKIAASKGMWMGGVVPLGYRSALYTVLKSPIYVGKISHKGEVFDGQREPIVDEDAWHRTQALLVKNRQGTHRRANAKAPSLLAGLVFDAQGEPMVAVHATKSSRRYRYYASKALHARIAWRRV